MKPVEIIHVGCYRKAQKLYQTRPYQSLCLFIDGVDRWVHQNRTVHHKTPLFYWAPKGEYQELDMNGNRENWVLIFAGPRIELTDDPDYIRYSDDHHDVLLPRYVPVSRQSLPGRRAEFAHLRDCALQPDVYGQFASELAFYSMLRYVAGPHHAPQARYRSPAHQLKELLDDDAVQHKPIAELSDRCGISRDHVRRQFSKEYGMTPQQYRTQRQIAKANQLMIETDKSIKQIARAVGFTQHAAFSAAYKRLTGRTPKVVAEELRGLP